MSDEPLLLAVHVHGDVEVHETIGSGCFGFDPQGAVTLAVQLIAAARDAWEVRASNGECDGRPVQGHFVSRVGEDVTIHSTVDWKLPREQARVLAMRLLILTEDS